MDLVARYEKAEFDDLEKNTDRSVCATKEYSDLR